MTDSFVNPQLAPSPSVSISPITAIRGVIYGLSLATLVLMAIGSATRVMNAGLSCPDWPLCYGSLVPTAEMNGQVFLEWFHRLVASSIGLTMVGLTVACWTFRRTLPRWLPAAVTWCLGLIIVQGILGGLTVTQLLRFDIVTAHLATGLLFFGSMVIIASFLQPYQGTGVAGNLYCYSSVAAICVYLQSILGALVSSQWAVHQCLEGSHLCQVLHSHLLGAIPVGVSILVLVFRARLIPALHPQLRHWSRVVLGLLILQVGLGISTLRLRLQVEWLTVSHQAIAATLLGVLVILSVIGWRDRTQTTYPIFQVQASSNPEDFLWAEPSQLSH